MTTKPVVESGPVAEIFHRPRMPYTAGLIASIPRLGSTAPGQRLRTIPGSVPSLAEVAGGCRFACRCPHAMPACSAAEPALEETPDGHRVRCIRWRELDLSTEVRA